MRYAEIEFISNHNSVDGQYGHVFEYKFFRRGQPFDYSCKKRRVVISYCIIIFNLVDHDKTK